MFAPIGATPIGENDATTGALAVASGSFDVPGAATAGVLVAGALAQTVAFAGAATTQGGYVEQGALLGLGPLGAGAIGEILSTSTPIMTITGTASGSFALSGALMAALPIIGRAPDISLAAWVITSTDGGAIINSAPVPPTIPAWNVSIGPPGFTVLDYPNYTFQVSSIPFFGASLSAHATSSVAVSSSGLFPVTGLSSGGARAAGSGAGQIEFFGSSFGAVGVSGAAVGSLYIGGLSVGVVGAVPINGIVSGDLGAACMASGVVAITGGLDQSFNVHLSGTSEGEIFGVLLGSFDIFATAEIKQPSRRRVASPRESMNGGRVLGAQNTIILES